MRTSGRPSRKSEKSQGHLFLEVVVSQYTPVQDVRAFLALKGNKRVRESHELKGRVMHWPFCVHCGLVALKNQVSRDALKKPCVVWE